MAHIFSTPPPKTRFRGLYKSFSKNILKSRSLSLRVSVVSKLRILYYSNHELTKSVHTFWEIIIMYFSLFIRKQKMEPQLQPKRPEELWILGGCGPAIAAVIVFFFFFFSYAQIDLSKSARLSVLCIPFIFLITSKKIKLRLKEIN